MSTLAATEASALVDVVVSRASRALGLWPSSGDGGALGTGCGGDVPPSTDGEGGSLDALTHGGLITHARDGIRVMGSSGGEQGFHCLGVKSPLCI
jgi:hypothetical protein